jgi:hypothetical protein
MTRGLWRAGMGEAGRKAPQGSSRRPDLTDRADHSSADRTALATREPHAIGVDVG